MSNDLAIGLRCEEVPLRLELRTEGLMVFYDVVVNQRNAIIGMRMGVHFAGGTVGSPARMADAYKFPRAAPGPRGPGDRHPCRLPDAGRSSRSPKSRRPRIAAVFEPPQSLH